MTKPARSISKKALLDEAQQHLKKGSVIKAMQIYYDLHEREPNSIEILTQLVAINLHMDLSDQANVNLQKLISLEPTKSSHYDQLANVYNGVKDFDQACKTYYTLLARVPRSPEAHFNLAFYLRKAGRFELAIQSYQEALSYGIGQPEEAHLNIAVILADELRKEDEAEEQLREALKINSRYLPALYNLANLYEDRGDKNKTIELFERILSIEPDHAQALSRLVTTKNIESVQDPLIAQLTTVGKSRDLPLSAKIDALYALGKAHDDCKDYDWAFQYYQVANELNARQISPYDQTASEDYFDRIIESVSTQWINDNSRDGQEQPVFICGMFRSGSTLLEQMLASHPAITAGGERDSFIREISQQNLNSPADLVNLAKKDLHKIADRYLSQSAKLFPDAQLLTDKRPDNFLYIGLLKALFPKSKIIYTRRQPLDNCLSVYFVRLGQAMNYSVRLNDIAHYYDQQTRLLKHWQMLLGDDLQIVDYDELIENPRPGLENVLNYLGLEWHDHCLEFHQLKNTVKTASVWQVRRPLYTSSSGRWRNYEGHITDLIRHYDNKPDGSERG